MIVYTDPRSLIQIYGSSPIRTKTPLIKRLYYLFTRGRCSAQAELTSLRAAMYLWHPNQDQVIYCEEDGNLQVAWRPS